MILTSILILTGTGIFVAIAIGLVAKYFGAPPNPKAERLAEMMPGANCGGCGFAGCGDYAKAMLEGKAAPGHCPSMSKQTIAAISKLLGVEAQETEPKVAVVCCSGDDNHAVRRAFYNGINDCSTATQVAGAGKACLHGCLGLGTCARACPFGAIEVTSRHIAIVHPEICVGCGKCTTVCPRHIIKLVPRTAKIHVFCSSPEPFKTKKEICTGACIGCRKCAKAAQEGQINFEAGKFLAKIDYANPPAPEVAESCPAKCLRSNKTR